MVVVKDICVSWVVLVIIAISFDIIAAFITSGDNAAFENIIEVYFNEDIKKDIVMLDATLIQIKIGNFKQDIMAKIKEGIEKDRF
jgi:hypothetical protein